MTLKDFRNIPFRLSALDSVYPGISEMTWKAKRLEEKNEITRLKRGLYVVAPEISGVRINDFLLANHIYGPSYVSMESALRYYGLIPEAVFSTLSVTVGNSTTFTNRFGTFKYIHCSDRYFPIGIRTITEDDASFLIASPEKALCDLIVFTPNVNLRYINEVKRWLDEQLRFDTEELMNFDTDILRKCAKDGKKKTMINQIIKIIENERNI